MKIKKVIKFQKLNFLRWRNVFKLSETKGKKVLLTFYRVAGCSFCNLRLIEFQKKSHEFGKNFIHVGIFHSPIENLRRVMNKHKELKFKILADEDFKYLKNMKWNGHFQLIMTLVLSLIRHFQRLLRACAYANQRASRYCCQ